MKSFKTFILEAKEGIGLTVFDIDDTLFHTFAKIKVMKDGKEVESLTNQEFNVYKLKERSSMAGKISAEKRKSDPEYKRKHSEKMKLWWAERKMKEGIVNGD